MYKNMRTCFDFVSFCFSYGVDFSFLTANFGSTFLFGHEYILAILALHHIGFAFVFSKSKHTRMQSLCNGTPLVQFQLEMHPCYTGAIFAKQGTFPSILCTILWLDKPWLKFARDSKSKWVRTSVSPSPMNW